MAVCYTSKMTENYKDYSLVRAVLDLLPEPDSVDVKFYNNGNTAIAGYFSGTSEIIAVIERKKRN